MNLKHIIVSALGGIVAGMLLLTFGFGYVSSGTATKMARDAAEAASVAALVPYCVEAAEADEAGLAEMLSKANYQRRSVVEDKGWAIYPAEASNTLKRAIGDACVAKLID